MNPALSAGIPLFVLFMLQQSPATVELTVLKIASGPSGEVRNGTYVLHEERASFDPQRDKQVVVSFVWQGQPGAHRMMAQWKGPDGSMSVPPPVQYEAKDRRFGAFWSLTLSPNVAPGTWAIEATVDGHPGGRYTFEIAPAPGSSAPVATKRVVSPAELFTRASATHVLLERATADGQRLDSAAAYVAGHGRLISSVAAIDGADVVTAVFPDGTRKAVTEAFAMSRLQDWIVLAGGPADESATPRAADSAVQIGDRLSLLEASNAASRILVDGAVSGRANSAGIGTRILVTLGGGATPPGSAVFNDFGELVGIVGGSFVPGATDLSDLMRFRSELKGVPVIPHSLIRVSSDGATVSLAELRVRGDLLAAVQRGQDVMSGGFSRGITRTQTVVPADQRREFSSHDKDLTVFVTWTPQSRLKGTVVLKVYDEQNRLVVESKPGKLNLRPGDARLSSWQLTTPTRPGVYRADVLVDNVPIWRSFVRITD